MMNTGNFSQIRVKKPSAVFSPVKTAKLLFPQVGEIKEEDKNETEEDLSQIDLLDGGKPKVLGILALTKENLKRLDLKNQRRGFTNTMMGEIMNHIEDETKLASELNFSQIAGMTCGKMMKLTEVLGSFLGNTFNVSSSSSSVFKGMLSTLYENECRKSWVGNRAGVYESQIVQSLYGGYSRIDRYELASLYQNGGQYYCKRTLSEVNKINNFSHLSVAGSDEYRNDVMMNDMVYSDDRSSEEQSD